MKEFFPKHKANMEISAPPAPTALDSLVTNRIDRASSPSLNLGGCVKRPI